jgi:hypothetical protein
MFHKNSNGDYKEVVEGVRLKTLVHGERTLLCDFRIEGGRRSHLTATIMNRPGIWSRAI